MRDPRWMGTQPSNVFWSWDSKSICFSWFPDRSLADSAYRFFLNSKAPVKADFKDAARLKAISNGSYNTTHTQIAYTFNNDIYLLDIATNKTIRITQTEEAENNPKIILNDEWVSFEKNKNLFAWDVKTGATKQLTNFAKAAITTPPANLQEQWLKENQLQTSDVLKERRAKREARDSFLRNAKAGDTIRLINIGDKEIQNIQVSPGAKFITYRLHAAPANTKSVIVPDYVTESGFTSELPARTKVGAPFTQTDFYVYDREKDTVILVAINNVPGIRDAPDYLEDYPKKHDTAKAALRDVTVYGPYWNEAGTNAFVEIRAYDNKDRWLMQLEAHTGTLKLIDRQRDEAWIAGPGIGDESPEAKLGWIDNNTLYYQSEATGYSHVYTYDIVTSIKTQVTKGNYEVQNLVLSKSKKHFYILTNEDHPGKQNWYRINMDGSGKEKITSMTGGYEVSMSPDEKYIAYRYSYSNKPWELFVQENKPGKIALQVTNKSMSDEFKMYAWREPKMVIIPARDGAIIYGRLYEPDAGKKNGAAVIFVHGAGYLQNVHYWWSSYFREYMFNNLLAAKGYTVIDVDYRASSGYGRNWRTGIYRFMGGKDLDDNIDAIKWLEKNYGIDSNRVGMYGGSYGGFITLMTLFTKSGTIKAGAALRPVTDWAHYNHGYTSNILNEPVSDSLAYARSSPINFAAGLKDHLLICHGMLDVNVNFQDVVRLTQRLIELGKDNWELAPYPLEDHAFVEPGSWTDEYKRVLKLFDDNLLK
jgi:dipeptidyl aminopeptidase/acylaminoacyl peptidase